MKPGCARQVAIFLFRGNATSPAAAPTAASGPVAYVCTRGVLRWIRAGMGVARYAPVRPCSCTTINVEACRMTTGAALTPLRGKVTEAQTVNLEHTSGGAPLYDHLNPCLNPNPIGARHLCLHPPLALPPALVDPATLRTPYTPKMV